MKGATMSDPGAGVSHYQSIERETVRLLVEALKRDHSENALLIRNHPDDVLLGANWGCQVCQLIKRCER